MCICSYLRTKNLELIMGHRIKIGKFAIVDIMER